MEFDTLSNGSFIYFKIPVLGGIPVTQTTVTSFLAALIIILASVKIGRSLKKRPGGFQVLVEKGVSMLYNMVRETMGEHNLNWAPFIGTIFLSSLLGSFLGLTGILRPSTADLSCVMVWALMVTAITWFNGIRYNGFFGWLKGFTEPVKVMTPMNIISEIAQPVSMAFRHFGNVAGGGIITTILYGALTMLSGKILGFIASSGVAVAAFILASGIALILLWRFKYRKKRLLIPAILMAVLGLFGLLQAVGVLSGVPVLAFGIPAVLSCYFDLFSGFVQAYVFTLLTMVYIGASIPERAGATDQQA